MGDANYKPPVPLTQPPASGPEIHTGLEVPPEKKVEETVQPQSAEEGAKAPVEAPPVAEG